MFIGFGLVLAGLAVYMTRKYRPCDECDGEGQQYDDYTDTLEDCPVCQGYGYVPRQPPTA